jgi:hypothetical protein
MNSFMASDKQSHAPNDSPANTLFKRNSEIVLKDASAVRRAKKVKLNSLYFNSQIKNVVFYDLKADHSVQQGTSPVKVVQIDAPAAGKLRCRSINYNIVDHRSQNSSDD